jgi:hypothetical protein
MLVRRRAGDMLKLRETPKAFRYQAVRPKGGGGRVNCLGYGHNPDDGTMDDPQPIPSDAAVGEVQRLNGHGSVNWSLGRDGFSFGRGREWAARGSRWLKI